MIKLSLEFVLLMICFYSDSSIQGDFMIMKPSQILNIGYLSVFKHCYFSVFRHCYLSVFRHCYRSVFRHCYLSVFRHCYLSVFRHCYLSVFRHCYLSVFRGIVTFPIVHNWLSHLFLRILVFVFSLRNGSMSELLRQDSSFSQKEIFTCWDPEISIDIH